MCKTLKSLGRRGDLPLRQHLRKRKQICSDESLYTVRDSLRNVFFFLIHVSNNINPSPYFKLDGGVVQADCLCEEGGSDGGLLELVELSLYEPQHQGGLANCGFA